MDERNFKKHLAALAHGHHHPEEHDWQGTPPTPAPETTSKPGERPKRKSARKAAKKK